MFFLCFSPSLSLSLTLSIVIAVIVLATLLPLLLLLALALGPAALHMQPYQVAPDGVRRLQLPLVHR